MTTTVPDCHLDGQPIHTAAWGLLTSDELARVVGDQCPGGFLERANVFEWRCAVMDTEALRSATEDGDEPEGGWSQAHLRHCVSDEAAIHSGSPEYAGRSHWLEYVWGQNTSIYPLYLVKENDGFRLLDGYHRLAGAFHFGIQRVTVLLGESRH